MPPRARATPQARPGGKQGGLGFKSVKAVASSAKGAKGAPSASAGAASAKRAAQPGKGGNAARADAAPAPPVLQWDKHAMMALLNAVRAESFGEVTLNPSQDDGYLARLVARVRTPAFAPTDAQVCLQLFAWRAQYGDSQEAFEKCEMSVQRSEAAKRHEKIWASQDVSRSSVGEHSSQVKRVARASYAAPPSPTKRMSAFASSGSPTTPHAAPRPEPAPTHAPRKRKQGAAMRGKGKEMADQSDHEAGEDDGAEGLPEGRTRRKLSLDNVGDKKEKGGAAKAAATGEDDRAQRNITSSNRGAGGADCDVGGSSMPGHDRTAKTPASSKDRPRKEATRPAAAAAPRGGGGGGSAVAGGGAGRRRWSAPGSYRAPPAFDPNAGVSGFLLRARNALRDAGGADAYSGADVSRANGSCSLAEVLGSGAERGVRDTCTNSRSNAVPSSNSKGRHKASVRCTGDTVDRDIGVAGGAVMAWAETVVRRQLSTNHIAESLDRLDTQLGQVAIFLWVHIRVSCACEPRFSHKLEMDG